MLCLGFEPGPQDGRYWRFHLATAAAQFLNILGTKALVD